MGEWRDLAQDLADDCFDQLSDALDALYTPAGSSVGVQVAAQLAHELVELPDRTGTLISDTRPVVRLPSAMRPVARGATVRVNGVLWTVEHVIADDGYVIAAVVRG